MTTKRTGVDDTAMVYVCTVVDVVTTLHPCRQIGISQPSPMLRSWFVWTIVVLFRYAEQDHHKSSCSNHNLTRKT